MTGLLLFKKDFRLEKSLFSYTKQLKPGQKWAVKGQDFIKIMNYDAIKSNIVEKRLLMFWVNIILKRLLLNCAQQPTMFKNFSLSKQPLLLHENTVSSYSAAMCAQVPQGMILSTGMFQINLVLFRASRGHFVCSGAVSLHLIVHGC